MFFYTTILLIIFISRLRKKKPKIRKRIFNLLKWPIYPTRTIDVSHSIFIKYLLNFTTSPFTSPSLHNKAKTVLSPQNHYPTLVKLHKHPWIIRSHHVSLPINRTAGTLPQTNTAKTQTQRDNEETLTANRIVTFDSHGSMTWHYIFFEIPPKLKPDLKILFFWFIFNLF